MPLIRHLDVEIETETWETSVPPEVAGMAGPWQPDMDVALLHTAVWTRPPVYRGLSLSDLWAWLRYRRAFSSNLLLGLSADWSEIDAHQKTVASDDLGVGVITYVLAEKLGFTYFSDTRRIVAILQSWGIPGVALSSSNKRGPRKAPDYLALDSDGQVSAVECKGTQTSVDELEYAMQGGHTQKHSLTAPGLRHSLVAGLFIPQHDSDETALIRIADPDPVVPIKAVMEHNRDFVYAVLRVALAKHFSLKADITLANALSNPDERYRRALPARLRAQLKESRTFLDAEHSFRTSLPLVDSGAPKELVFEMTGSEAIKDAVLSDDLEGNLLRWFENGRAIKWRWRVRESESGVDLYSPFGFRLSLFLQ